MFKAKSLPGEASCRPRPARTSVCWRAVCRLHPPSTGRPPACAPGPWGVRVSPPEARRRRPRPTRAPGSGHELRPQCRPDILQPRDTVPDVLPGRFNHFLQTRQMENKVFSDPPRGCKALAASGQTIEERLQTGREENMIESEATANRWAQGRSTCLPAGTGRGRGRAEAPGGFLFALCRDTRGPLGGRMVP